MKEWRAVLDQEHELWMIQTAEGDYVADLSMTIGDDKKEFEANARLIAAAPELLAICEQLAAHIIDPKEDECGRAIRPVRLELAENARAVIATVRGG